MGIIIKFVLKNIWAKKLRTLLIVTAVMLSSALYFATEALSGTAADMFIERVRVYYGTADLMIHPTEGSPSSLFRPNRAEMFAGDFEYIVGSIETGGTLVLPRETLRMTIKGFNLPELAQMNPFYLAAQEQLYPFQGKKIILSKQTAEEYGLRPGDYLDIEVLGAKRKFFLAALAEPAGPFQHDGQNINAVVPLDTLATIVNARGRVTNLYLKVKDPARKGELLQKLRALYPRYQVRETVTGQELAEYTSSLTMSFQLMGTVVLFMAVYIIYSSFKVITRERLPVLGTFRSIGATRRMTNLILCAESVMYGVIGGFLGCGLGLVLLYLIALQVRPDFMASVPVKLQFSPGQLGAAFLLAVLVAFLSALRPIRKAAKIPVKELIFNLYSKPGRRERWRPAGGVILIALSFLLPPHLPYQLLLPGGMLLLFATIIGFILMIPSLTKLFLAVLARLNRYFFGNEGVLAAKNLRENQGVLNNISLLAIGISALLMINTVSYSTARELTNFYRDFNFQIWFWTWQADRGIESILRSVDGVTSTYGIYTANAVEITNRNDRINLLHGANPHKYLEYHTLDLDPALLAELDTGRKILLTNTLRERLQVKKGDVLTLKTARGERDYQVIGFFDSLMWNGNFALIGERFIKMDMGKQYYDDLFVKTNKDPELVREAIKTRLARRSPFVITLAQMAKDNQQANDRILRVMQGFSLLALVIGIFGVFNNLIISFLERQRALAMLRSLGMSKAQSIKMFFAEALTGGLIGGVVGALCGYRLNTITPLVIKALLGGLPIFHFFPLYLSAVLAGLLIMVTASASPAFKASRLDIVSTIKYE